MNGNLAPLRAPVGAAPQLHLDHKPRQLLVSDVPDAPAEDAPTEQLVGDAAVEQDTPSEAVPSSDVEIEEGTADDTVDKTEDDRA